MLYYQKEINYCQHRYIPYNERCEGLEGIMVLRDCLGRPLLYEVDGLWYKQVARFDPDEGVIYV